MRFMHTQLRVILLILGPLVLPGLVSAGVWGDLADRAEKKTSSRELLAFLAEELDDVEGSHLGDAIEELRDAGSDSESARKKVVNIMRLYDAAELVSVKSVDTGASPTKIASTILSRDEFKEKKAPEGSNWFSKIFEGFRKWLENLFDRPKKDSNSDFNPNGNFEWLRVLLEVFRVLLVLLIAGALVLLVATLFKNLSIRSRSFLDEGEELRTREEYLDLADQLVQTGELRFAIRALYVASLLRLDELKIARFDRSDTNWEHLARFEASPTRPAEIDFRAVTRNFDRFWYGRVALEIDDVRAFREVHDRLAAMEVPK